MHLKPSLRWLEYTLWAIGICATAYAGGVYIYAHADQAYLNWWFDHWRRHPSQVPLKAGEVVGRLEVPRLHLSTIVLEGAAPSILDRAVGHIPGTALPGQTGNVAVAGHRDTFFRPLRMIHRNDIIVFTTGAGAYRYRVDRLRIVQPGETDVLHSSGQPVLTLVTCYPFHYIGSAPDRFVVRAVAYNPVTPAKAKRAGMRRSQSTLRSLQ